MGIFINIRRSISNFYRDKKTSFVNFIDDCKQNPVDISIETEKAKESINKFFSLLVTVVFRLTKVSVKLKNTYFIVFILFVSVMSAIMFIGDSKEVLPTVSTVEVLIEDIERELHEYKTENESINGQLKSAKKELELANQENKRLTEENISLKSKNSTLEEIQERFMLKE